VVAFVEREAVVDHGLESLVNFDLRPQTPKLDDREEYGALVAVI